LLKALGGALPAVIPDDVDQCEAVVDVRDGSTLVFSGVCALSQSPGRDALGGTAANAADGARCSTEGVVDDFPVSGFCSAFRTVGSCELRLVGHQGIVAYLPMTFLSLTHGPFLDEKHPQEYGYEYAVGLVHDEGILTPSRRGDPRKQAMTRAGVILAGWDAGLDRFDAGYVVIGKSPFCFSTRKEFVDSNRCRSE
jgi:hypothetical protein